MMKWDEHFLWGAATSAHQIDGGNTASDWWAWENEGKTESGESSGRATDHWNRFREDIRLAAELGLNSYRFSVEWARLEPKEGEWDEEALSWYCELLSECEKNGLLPMATLQHFTLPKWLANQGGFTSPRAPELFERYVRTVVERMGSRIPIWCTINEPMVLAVGSYLGKFMPPGQYDPEKLARASAAMLKGHVLAYDIIHSEIRRRVGPWKEFPVQVGIAHNMMDFRPARAWNPLDVLFTRRIHRLFNLSWIDALTGKKQHFGIRGILPIAQEVQEARGRQTVDFIGLNYYTKALVRAQAPGSELPVALEFAAEYDAVSDLGWAIHPKGLGRILRTLAACRLPVYITENGIADSKDRNRADYLYSHLRQLAIARNHGADIRGYYHWSLLDNFEWSKGFGPRFGLYQVDYETMERKKNPSAEFYRKIALAHQVSGRSVGPRPELFGVAFEGQVRPSESRYPTPRTV